MKKCLYLFLLLVVTFSVNRETLAVPAYPYPVEIKQPDGTKLVVTLQGDEHVKWALTSDGYSLLYNAKGIYEYAIQNAKGDLVPSGIKAKDAAKRNPSEMAFLANIKKGLTYSRSQISLVKSIYAIKANEVQKAFPTTGSRKLVCILIGFSDLAFTKTQTDFINLLNQVGYTTDGATGSVKDYYLENSYNKFTLSVDVAGPYTASNAMAYYGGNDINGNDLRPRELITEAVNFANPNVNYANYDNDGDGSVDGIYVIFAGYGEEAGASANAIWSHSWTIPTLTLDGKSVSKYACSPELRNTSGTGITRIGVICHEFGHVLGAPDFYDTDYSGTGGSFIGTGRWDMMAGGSWNNNGATPAHHNAYTKVHIYNWAGVTTLNSANTITFNNAVENEGSFYEYTTLTSGEYFIMENRQQIGFDASIPGEGLIIYHVHSQIASAGNSINAGHPQKMYPVCANAGSNPTSSVASYGDINTAGCPFPGSGNKTSFTDATLPGSVSWAVANTNKPITNITFDGLANTITLDFMGGGVTDNVSNFTSTAISESQIDMAWNLNTGRNVLLAWSSDGTFGTPVNGVDYSAGDSIPGGGEVVYAGGNVAFSHTALNANTTYYYKIWTKVDAIPTWSTGVTSQSKTNCSGTAQTIPFTEQFSTTSLPGCWSIEDHTGNGQIWEFGIFSGGLVGGSGNYAFLNSDGFGSGNSQNADLITPTIDFTGVEYPSVKFQHFFESYSGSSARFSYSIDNGSTWNVVKTWNIATSNPAEFNQLISAVSGYSQVKFKWNYTGTWGYYWCIDNIEVYSDSLATPSKREAQIKRLPDGYAPVMDGVVDELWANVEANTIDRNFTGEFPSLYNANWKAVWNDTTICVLVEVSENNFWPSWLSGLADWQSDKLEIYVDVNETLEDSLGAGPGVNSGHYQFGPNYSEINQGTESYYNGIYVADTWTASPASYVYEYRIPFTTLLDNNGYELDPFSRYQIGFDVTVIDLDEGDFARNRAVWSNIGSLAENWTNMDSAGIVQFVTDEIVIPTTDNPTNFVGAVYSSSQIDLSWVKNAERNVILAWSSNGTFGTPETGFDYSEGDSISGGGTIIYAGSNQSYSHTGLAENTTYYYKIWTRLDAIPGWSTGALASAHTTLLEAPYYLSARVENTNDVVLKWNTDSTQFMDGFESGDFWSWSDVIEGNGIVGDSGLAYWHVQDSPGYVLDGTYSALVNYGYNINTWLIAPEIRATSNTIVAFNWASSYGWNVSPHDNGDLFVKVSLDGGNSWEPYLWTFGEIDEWEDWTWNQAILDLSVYKGLKIVVAFHIVANDNADILLENVYIGDFPEGTHRGIRVLSTATSVNTNSKSARSCNSLKRPQTIQMSSFSGYAVYRDGVKIGETSSTNYTDAGLSNGLHTYYITSLYSSPAEESLPSNEVEIRIGPNSIQPTFTSTDISLYPVPAREVLNVALNGLSGNIDLEIYTLIGKSVYNTSANCTLNKQVEQIKLTDLSPGVYFLKVNDQTKSGMYKFTIE